MALDIERVRALCFDVDGTLRDTDDEYVNRLAGYLSKILPPGREPKLIARRMVMAVEDPGNLALGLADRLGLDSLLARALHAIEGPRPIKAKKTMMIAGVREMLETLGQSFPLAVISARSQRITMEFLQGHQLERLFRVIVTGQTCRRTKPHPMPVLWAAEQMGVPPEACLMIGDTVVDIRAGRAAGAQTVGVLCGFGRKDELLRAGAHLILQTTSELESYLRGR